MANRCFFIGRLVQDPNIIVLSNGSMATFSLAVKRNYATVKNQADFVDFRAFNSPIKNADFIGRYCKKGMQCYIESEFNTHTKDSQDPTQKAIKEKYFVVTKIEILSTKEEMKNYHNREQVENRPTQNRQKPKLEEDNSGYAPFDDTDDFTNFIPF